MGLRRYIWSAGRMRIDAATPLLQDFVRRDVTFMPIKGSALLARDAQAMSDRFLGDIDVLIHLPDWEKAITIALEQGWSNPSDLERDIVVHHMRQRHHSLDITRGAHGAVDLHQFSLLPNRQLGADVLLWNRAGTGTLNGVPVLLPHPSDQLAIIFGHCFLYSNPRSYDWVADAVATISAPGFDWDLFTEVIIDRELAVPAATALTYLAEELQWAIPAAVIELIVARVREPFLREFAASYRTYLSSNAQECRAIYEAECIRSRHFLERASIPHETAQPREHVDATITEIRPNQKFVLPMPAGVEPTDRVQFRVRFDIVDKWRGVSALAPGKSLLVRLGCFDNVSIELGRLHVRSRRDGPQELTGEIDGALIVGRGIDELWLSATIVREEWLLRWNGLRDRVSDYIRSGEWRAVWSRRRRKPGDRMGRAVSAVPEEMGCETPPGIIRGGSFEAFVLRPANGSP